MTSIVLLLLVALAGTTPPPDADPGPGAVHWGTTTCDAGSCRMPLHPPNALPNAIVELTLAAQCLGAECTAGRPLPVAASAILRDLLRRSPPDAELKQVQVRGDEVHMHGEFPDAAQAIDSLRGSDLFELARFPDHVLIDGRTGLQSVGFDARSGRPEMETCNGGMGARRVSVKTNADLAAIVTSAAAQSGCEVRSNSPPSQSTCGGELTGADAGIRCLDPWRAIELVERIERAAPDAVIGYVAIQQEFSGPPATDYRNTYFNLFLGLRGSVGR